MYLNIKNISGQTLSDMHKMQCNGIIFEVAGNYIKPGKSIKIKNIDIPLHANSAIKDAVENKMIELTKLDEIESNELKSTLPKVFTQENTKDEISENLFNKSEFSNQTFLDEEKTKKKKG